MASLDELDQPRHWAEPDQRLEEPRKGQDPTFHPVAPAWFAAMSWEQLADWPNRAAGRWMRSRSWWLLLPVLTGSIVWGAGGGAAATGAAGLITAIIGLWLLSESLLLSDGDAAYLSTWGGGENRYLIVRRDRRRAYFSLVIVTLGLGLHVVTLLVAAF
jgi:hypothetical protein